MDTDHPRVWRVYLMDHPWAARPAALIEATDLREWRQAIAAVPPLRSGKAYAAAVELLDRDPSGKPYPVQTFRHSNDLFPSVTDTAGFLAVRTGLVPEIVARGQWEAILAVPDYFREWDKFFGGFRDMFRQAIHPPPHLVDRRGKSPLRRGTLVSLVCLRAIPAAAGNMPNEHHPQTERYR